MFVVLRVNAAPEGVFKKSKIKKTVIRACLQTCKTGNGLPFYILDIPEQMSMQLWDRVEEKCGRYASRIVAPRSITLPDCGKIRRFVSGFMPSLLTFNTAVKTIKNANIPPESISITLTDRNAYHATEIQELLPFTSTLRIITAHPERYAHACEKAFTEYGASIILRSCYEPCARPDILICCDGRLAPNARNAAIFSHKSKAFGKLHITGSGVELKPAHRDIIPECIDPIDFSGAVTELCGSPEYKKSCFEKTEASCAKCPDKTPEACLLCFSQGRM